jgi:flagellar protein FlaF
MTSLASAPLNAYQRAISRAESPRDTEHRLLGQITGEMLAARDAKATGAALASSLHRNREMWSAFATDCGATGNALPPILRAQIISLALWVDRYTSDVLTGRDTIDALIDLNRAIMDGLRGETTDAH